MNNRQPTQPTGIVYKIQKYAIHDGPGIRTTVFLKGCPLTCRWCHNPESISPEIETIQPPPGRNGEGRPVRPESIGRPMTVNQVLAEVEKDRIFYDESGGGVTLSGGEPLMQPDFVLALASACSGRDLHVTLDTSGQGPAPVLDKLLRQVHLVLFDLKLADRDVHKQYTGVANDLILANLRRLDAAPVPYRIRVPVIAGITDTPEAVEGLARILAGLKKKPAVDLLPYHATAEAKYERLGIPYCLKGLNPPAPQRMDDIALRLHQCGLNTHIGGAT